MWWFNVTQEQLNIVLNLAGVVLGGGALGVVLSHFRGMRTLTDAETADIRKHYAAELARAVAEIAALRQRIDEQDKRYMDFQKEADERQEASNKRWRQANEYHEQCLAERAEMRQEIEGLKTQLKRYSANALMILEDDPEHPKPSSKAPEAVASASRVLKITGNGK